MKNPIDMIRDYDICFASFVVPSRNGQKHMQTILLRESFKHLRNEYIAMEKDGPTSILDVSCGRGDYSKYWTSTVAKYLPQGMRFFCTDVREGFCKDTGERYVEATKRKIIAARDILKLIGQPIGIECNLYATTDRIAPPLIPVNIVHWSHSGYHVRDTLGSKKDDLIAIRTGLATAIGKIWSAFNEQGVMFSIHQSNDTSDGEASQMASLVRPYTGLLDDVPVYIDEIVHELGGHVITVYFNTPLEFPIMKNDRWEALKDQTRWMNLDSEQQRTILLLSFIVHDFSNHKKSGLEKLADNGKLDEFVDLYKNVVKQNGGYINIKCAFQMICKSATIARKLEVIGRDLQHRMPEFVKEMNWIMVSLQGGK